MTDPTALTAPAPEVKFPSGIPFIVGNEGAERFSFYGMRAILKTYLTALFLAHFTAMGVSGDIAKTASSQATAITHLFIAGVYAFPMIGALFADRLLGKYPVIFWVSLVYCAGHGVLAVAGHFGSAGSFTIAEYGFYVGLALIAIGSGGIKPCVSANVGDQFTEKNKGLVTKVFQIFYFIINFGSFFSTIIIPILKDKIGPEVAFGVPGIFMGLATIVFWLGRGRFVRVPPKPGGRLGLLDAVTAMLFFTPVLTVIVAVFTVSHGFSAPPQAGLGPAEFYGVYLREYVAFMAANTWQYFAASAVAVAIGAVLFRMRQRIQQDTGFLPMLLYAMRNQQERKPGEGYFSPVRAKYGDEAAEGPPAVLRIILVFSMVSVFWALFDQHASTWITQAQSMKLDMQVPHYTWQLLMPDAANVGGHYVISGWWTFGLALFGAVWLFSWVANSPLPRRATVGVLLAFAGAVVVFGGLDVIHPRWEHQSLRAEQISALNPLMVMLIIPGLNLLVYDPLAKRGITIKPLQKMAVGMFLPAIAFTSAALLQLRIEAAGPGQVPVAWQTVQYLIMTTAEVLISVTGLEFAYTQAPRAMKSTIMGFWLLCVTGGNILVAFLAPMEAILKLSQFFWIFASLMTAASVVFAVLAYRYKGKTYLQA